MKKYLIRAFIIIVVFWLFSRSSSKSSTQTTASQFSPFTRTGGGNFGGGGGSSTTSISRTTTSNTLSQGSNSQNFSSQVTQSTDKLSTQIDSQDSTDSARPTIEKKPDQQRPNQKPTEQAPTSAAQNSAKPTEEKNVYVGQDVSVPNGGVQVAVTVDKGKMTAIDFLDYPDNSRSAVVDQQILSILKEIVLTTQNTKFIAFLGNSKLNRAFRESLESALSKNPLNS